LRRAGGLPHSACGCVWPTSWPTSCRRRAWRSRGWRPAAIENILAVPADVASLDDVQSLKDAVYAAFGEVGLLMNNAATRVGGGAMGRLEDWQEALCVNFWGVVHGVSAFVPRMIEQGEPCLVINTGSKQGITKPARQSRLQRDQVGAQGLHGGLAARAAQFPGCRVNAHLLVPGWTTTGNASTSPAPGCPIR